MGNENIFTKDDKVREDGVKVHKGEDGLYYYSQPNSNKLDHVVDLSNGTNNKGATYYDYNKDGTVKSTMTIDKATYLDLANKKERPIQGKTAGKIVNHHYNKGKLDHTVELTTSGNTYITGAKYYYYKSDGKTLDYTKAVDGNTYQTKTMGKTAAEVKDVPGKVEYADHSATSAGLKAQAQVSKVSKGSQKSSSASEQKFNSKVDNRVKIEEASRKAIGNSPIMKVISGGYIKDK